MWMGNGVSDFCPPIDSKNVHLKYDEFNKVNYVPEVHGLTGRTGNLKRLGIIQQSLNLLRSLSRNLLFPPHSLLFKIFPCFFWNSAHFFTLLK